MRSNGNILAGGNFTASGTTTDINRIAEWNGSNWGGLGGGLNGEVHSVAILTDGSIVVGGEFTAAGSGTPPLPLPRIAKWNGSTWSALGSGFEDGAVNCILELSSGEIVVGGTFTHSGSTYYNGIAKWNGTSWTTMDGGFAAGSGVADVTSLILDHDGTLVAAGSFDYPFQGVARWNASSWEAMGDELYDVKSMTMYMCRLTAMGAFGISQWNGVDWSWPVGKNVNGGSAWTAVSVPTTDILLVAGDFWYANEIIAEFRPDVAGWGLWEAYSCPADFNRDGLVDDADFLIFAESYDLLDCAAFDDVPLMPLHCIANLTCGDYLVDDQDFLIFLDSYDDLVCP